MQCLEFVWLVLLPTCESPLVPQEKLCCTKWNKLKKKKNGKFGGLVMRKNSRWWFAYNYKLLGNGLQVLYGSLG